MTITIPAIRLDINDHLGAIGDRSLSTVHQHLRSSSHPCQPLHLRLDSLSAFMSDSHWRRHKYCYTCTGRRRVVTVILRRQSDGYVLILQRSQLMKEFPGRWHFISGSLEVRDHGRCLERARAEVLEETGISELQLICQARPVRIEGRYLVHPILYEVADAHAVVVLNRENQAFQWVDPDQLDRIENTVPKLLPAWQRTQALAKFPENAKAGLRQLTIDRQMHPVVLACLAAECIDEFASSFAGQKVPLRALLDFAWAVAIARPLMATVSNAVIAVIKGVNIPERSPSMIPYQTVHDSVDRFLSQLDDEARELTTHAVHVLAAALKRSSGSGVGLRVLTHSDSPAIRDALLTFHKKGNDLANVIICESRPRFEGQRLAAFLCEQGIPCTLITDSQMVLFACNADIALVAAHTVRASHSGVDIMAKVGTYALALAAKERSVDIHVLAGMSKVHHGITPFDFEELPWREVTAAYPSKMASQYLAVRHVNYEAIPSRLLTSIVTNNGVMAADSLLPVALRNRDTFDETFF